MPNWMNGWAVARKVGKLARSYRNIALSQEVIIG